MLKNTNKIWQKEEKDEGRYTCTIISELLIPHAQNERCLENQKTCGEAAEKDKEDAL